MVWLCTATMVNGEVIRTRGCQTRAPDREADGEDVSVQERIQVGAAIVSSPALGMERPDGLDILERRTPEGDLLHLLR